MSEHKLKVYKKWYTIILTPDEANGSFVVTVDGLPEYITQGDNEKQALKNAKDCILEHLASIRNAEKLSKMTAKERFLYWQSKYEETSSLLDSVKQRRDKSRSEWAKQVESAKHELEQAVTE